MTFTTDFDEVTQTVLRLFPAGNAAGRTIAIRTGAERLMMVPSRKEASIETYVSDGSSEDVWAILWTAGQEKVFRHPSDSFPVDALNDWLQEQLRLPAGAHHA